MRHAVPLFLEDDTVDHIEWIAQQLSQQRNMTVSRSDAVAWLVKRHWVKMQKKLASAQR